MEKLAGLPEEARRVASVVGQAVHKGLAAVGVTADLLPLGMDQPQTIFWAKPSSRWGPSATATT